MAYTTINKPTDYFNTKLYTGDGSTQAITGVGFQPDWTWIKCRNRAEEHVVFDVIRGATKKIYPNLTAAEATEANTLTSFDSDGFSLGSAGLSNSTGDTFASWNWKANGAGSANTDGSINSTVSANTTSGFSIVSYTGTGANGTIGHNLGQAPDMIIVKRRDGADGWKVYHSSRGATKYLQLHTTDAEGTLSSQWNDTEPTSSVFSVGTAGDINGSGGRTYIAYCFAEKSGYSSMGQYTGNGNADGTFVYTGFKPAFVIAKDTSAVNNWRLFDNKRPAFNQTDKLLFPSLNSAETVNVSGSGAIDILSNGFKCKSSANGLNASGSTYIYMAFAEAPLVGTNNVPCTAR